MKLNSRGIAHYAAPLLVVLLVAVTGTFMLVASHANNARIVCGSGYKLVNSTPYEYTHAPTKNRGLVCAPNSANRATVKTMNLGTITGLFKCNSDSTFAYDKNNPDSGGYHNKYIFLSREGGRSFETKNYYCIKTTHLNKDLNHDGGEIDGSPIKGNPFNGDYHTYHFVPAYTSCSPGSAAAKHTNCQHNYFFKYYLDTTARRS